MFTRTQLATEPARRQARATLDLMIRQLANAKLLVDCSTDHDPHWHHSAASSIDYHLTKVREYLDDLTTHNNHNDN
jgi:hypothetical protein